MIIKEQAELVIPKDMLRSTDIIIQNKQMLKIITDWMQGDYKLFASIIRLICEVPNIIKITDFDINNTSFICLDKFSEPIQIKLDSNKENPYTDNQYGDRKIIISKDGNILSYDFDMDDSYIYLDSNQKADINTSNKKRRIKNIKRS